jgi:hypothetical protein
MSLYLDIPQRHYNFTPSGPGPGGHHHIEGSSQVQDLAYLIASTGSLAYLVFRDMRCEDNMRWDIARQSSASGDLMRTWNESIAIIDTKLRSCMDRVARCAPNSSAYFAESRSSASSYSYIDPRTKDNSEQDLYEVKFFYHHRRALEAGLPDLSSPLREQAIDLLGFLQYDQGSVYAETDDLLSRGLIHRDRLEMLFCPNDVLISRDSGLLSAFVLRSWPSGHSILTLDCWNWGFDGQWLHRKRTLKTLARPLKDIVQIRDLEVYPLRYASKEDVGILQVRGQKYWDLKYKNIASYEGWDFKAEQNYVRYTFSEQ